ncbi:p25 [Orgyia pseudotsugata multiple nucleopolyhedrovirus]|uniref:OPEP-2 protein n=1 Tax=Orgyia pseudotsugata multicapsid polyhedrosis virus TaxID=262177 RepID=OPEP2_NPVOP|nr:p25 [Orgyia pseudotsugata multiple nucleopolyhedrovirus]P89029.1 RecName: Full=OPEP-2 protein; AltName: Full=P25 [Orgyia pseudotsugata multiple nucleopolyhedrovirus]pir/T10417/ p25 protein - Orgyia pseudotsugata nuclear polyhedrosis virus [Orgyia pseudotsugata single capsid nuclopolyhedrovirus]AAB37304.1 opep-2 [Orgyia pseudotsugata single capsid nuclopolyhedrovirus]AAC59147.1 p25 [Orgyia pseudotsugata multiple nucleopolyhedrovirus]
MNTNKHVKTYMNSIVFDTAAVQAAAALQPIMETEAAQSAQVPHSSEAALQLMVETEAAQSVSAAPQEVANEILQDAGDTSARVITTTDALQVFSEAVQAIGEVIQETADGPHAIIEVKRAVFDATKMLAQLGTAVVKFYSPLFTAPERIVELVYSISLLVRIMKRIIKNDSLDKLTVDGLDSAATLLADVRSIIGDMFEVFVVNFRYAAPAEYFEAVDEMVHTVTDLALHVVKTVC